MNAATIEAASGNRTAKIAKIAKDIRRGGRRAACPFDNAALPKDPKQSLGVLGGLAV